MEACLRLAPAAAVSARVLASLCAGQGRRWLSGKCARSGKVLPMTVHMKHMPCDHLEGEG
jgi:hypothetical protein